MRAPICLQIVFRPGMDPFDRQWFEEQLEDAFAEEELGQVIGGGTAMDGSSSDIALELNKRVRGIAVIRDVLRREQAPRDTKIIQRGKEVVTYPIYDAKHPFVEPEKPAGGNAAYLRKQTDHAEPSHGDLPAVGDALLLSVPDAKVLTVCRVIRVVPAKSSPVLVTATNWFGQTPPDLADKRLKQPLVMTYVGGRGPFRSWVSGQPPNFTKLGTIPPTRKERDADSPFHSSWNVFLRTIASQLSWAGRQKAT